MRVHRVEHPRVGPSSFLVRPATSTEELCAVHRIMLENARPRPGGKPAPLVKVSPFGDLVDLVEMKQLQVWVAESRDGQIAAYKLMGEPTTNDRFWDHYAFLPKSDGSPQSELLTRLYTGRYLFSYQVAIDPAFAGLGLGPSLCRRVYQEQPTDTLIVGHVLLFSENELSKDGAQRTGNPRGLSLHRKLNSLAIGYTSSVPSYSTGCHPGVDGDEGKCGLLVAVGPPPAWVRGVEPTQGSHVLKHAKRPAKRPLHPREQHAFALQRQRLDQALDRILEPDGMDPHDLFHVFQRGWQLRDHYAPAGVDPLSIAEGWTRQLGAARSGDPS